MYQSGETSRRQLLLGKVRCRQPEKILFPPELAVFLAQPGQLSSFLSCELTLLGRPKVPTIDPGLPHPLGEAADGKPQPLGHSRADEALTEAQRYSLLLLLRREPAPGLGRVGH
jgi:hypothetical protein